MKTKKINSERRKFFSRLGIGALSAGLMSFLPSKLFSAVSRNNETSKHSVSISVNPMAVKRTTPGGGSRPEKSFESGKVDRNG